MIPESLKIALLVKVAWGICSVLQVCFSLNNLRHLFFRSCSQGDLQNLFFARSQVVFRLEILPNQQNSPSLESVRSCQNTDGDSENPHGLYLVLGWLCRCQGEIYIYICIYIIYKYTYIYIYIRPRRFTLSLKIHAWKTILSFLMTCQPTPP